MNPQRAERILFYDGVCNFCNATVQFVIKRDPLKKIYFAALQSKTAHQLLTPINSKLVHDLTTMVYLEGDNIYTKSDAFLHLIRHLNGFWPLLSLAMFFPRFFRNFVYDLVAKNRYRLFGKKEQCLMPTPDIRERFLDTLS